MNEEMCRYKNIVASTKEELLKLQDEVKSLRRRKKS